MITSPPPSVALPFVFHRLYNLFIGSQVVVSVAIQRILLAILASSNYLAPLVWGLAYHRSIEVMLADDG
jgi:hypothetical protein